MRLKILLNNLKPPVMAEIKGRVRVSFEEAILEQTRIKFTFQILQVTESVDQITGEKSKIAIIELHKPWPKVLGSQKGQDADGNFYDLLLEDVTTVRIRQNMFKHPGLAMYKDEDTGEWLDGEFDGSDAQFDIAKRSLDVWLVSETFAQAASRLRTDFSKKRMNDTQARLDKMRSARKMGENGKKEGE